jgi:hypothetical protein
MLKDLWLDESGAVMSAETVMIGTVCVVGAVTGLNAASHAVNEELKDLSRAIRSLDQSYTIQGHAGCGAMTAGSCFQQKPVGEALHDLDVVIGQCELTPPAPAEPEGQPPQVEPAPGEPMPLENQIPPTNTPSA